jgi:hypothetical protein
MVLRTLLNIQLLFYGMTYLMILEKLTMLTNLKTFHYLGMEMNGCKKINIIKVFSIILKHSNSIVCILLICRDGTFAI